MTIPTWPYDTHEITSAAADVVTEWTRHEVLPHLSASEAYAIANLFELHHMPHIAHHLRYEGWHAEDPTDRDPLPWANEHGSRLSDDDYQARRDDLAPNEGAEKFHFNPRTHYTDWEDDRA